MFKCRLDIMEKYYFIFYQNETDLKYVSKTK